MNTGTSLASARRKSVCMSRYRDPGATRGSDDSTSVAPSLSPRIVLISLAAAVMIGSSAFDPGAHTMDSRMIPRRMPASAPGVPGICAWLAYGVLQYRRARHGREGIARIVIACDRVLQGIEDFGAVGDAAENAAAIAVDVRPDRTAVKPSSDLCGRMSATAL